MSTESTKKLTVPPLTTVVLAAVLVLLVGYGMLGRRWDTVSVKPIDVGPPRAANTSPSKIPAAVNTDPAKLEFDETAQDVMEAVEAERRAVARARLLELQHRADETTAYIDRLEQAIGRWSSEIEPLLANETGKFIAANPRLVDAFVKIYDDSNRASKQTPERLREVLNAAMDPVSHGLESETAAYTPDNSLQEQLDRVRRQAIDALRTYDDDTRQIQSLLAASKQTSGARPGTKTLQAAIDDIQNRAALARAQAVALAVDEERRKADIEAAAQEAERVRNEAARELQKKRLQEELKKREAQRELERMREQEKQRAHQAKIDAKRRRAADPAVQARYQPFLAKGVYRFNAYGGTARTDAKYGNRYPQPASYSRLQNAGVLNNVATFVKTASGKAHIHQTGQLAPRLVQPDNDGYAGAGFSNDRPKWNWYPQGERGWKQAEAMYREFLELAPIWVETGKLLR